MMKRCFSILIMLCVVLYDVHSMFGMQILPEMVSENIYEKLTFMPINVPNFERDTREYQCVLSVQEELEAITQTSDMIESFKIMDSLNDKINSFSHQTLEMEACRKCDKFMAFWNSVYVSMRIRLFESGNSEDYGLAHCFSQRVSSNFCCQLLKQKDQCVSNDILPTVGLYIYSLYKSSLGLGRYYFPGTPYIEINKESVPASNIFSWTLSKALVDTKAQGIMLKLHPLFFGNFPPDVVLLEEENL